VLDENVIPGANLLASTVIESLEVSAVVTVRATVTVTPVAPAVPIKVPQKPA